MPDWTVVPSATNLKYIPGKFKALSPLEDNIGFTEWLTNILSHHLILNVITVILLLILTLILILKFLVKKDIQFSFLSKITLFNFKIGDKLNKFLSWYISIWQKMGNLWVFYILFFLLNI
jgi:CBS domain containing-hemolysin-like protein